MKKTALVILLLLACCPAFAKRHKHPKKQQAGNEVLSVALQRTGCYGRCPVYEVEIKTDGTVTYTGIRFTADSGIFTKNIGAASALKVISDVNSYRPDTCQDSYFNRVPDLPGINFTIVYTNKTKYIRNARYGPGFFQALATEIDATGKKTDNEGWQKVELPPIKK